ncbi:MAG: Aerobic respiration control sensor protein ArcB [Pseudomonadota bacterium]|jgi:signal transduction histidine kinase/CheY-like chemotaxis protein
MLAKLAFLLLPKDLFQGRPTERLLRASGWTYLCGVVVSLALYAIAHPQYDYRIHLLSTAVFLLSYASVRMGIINYTWIKFGALWSLLEFIYVTANTGGINSPAMVWMTIIGVVVILYFNRLATQISIAFLFSLYLVFYLLGQQGVVSSEVLVEQQTIAWALTYKFSVIVMVFLGALATDWMYGHLLEEIDTKNKELEDTQQKILQAQAHKDEFIASIGHELRTPMNAILGFNDILRQELANNKENVHVVDLIKKSTEQLLQLVNNVLDFSQLQANRMQLVVNKFSLSHLAHEVFGKYQTLAQEKNLRLVMDTNAVHDIWASGDKLRIMQALQYLLDNALKFTNEGQITVRITQVEAHVRFEVQDTGIGIAPEKQSQIFQRFEQANLETSRQYGGSGLGLAICDRLVRRMGGEMGVKSAAQSGATFWFTLPLPTEHVEFKNSALDAHTNWSKAAIQFLLVDDNAVNLMVAKLLLTKCFPNCSVTEVVSGQAALDALAHQVFDMVLMDVVMPDMDGPTATQAIRKNLGAPANQIPVMAITANTHPVDRERYLAAGMNDVIHKPLEIGEMASRISAALSEHARVVGL